MKKTLASLVLALVISPVAVNAQLVVNDPANLAQALQQVTLMTQQIEQLKSQLLKQEQTLASLTGSSGIGNLLNGDISTLKGNLPSDWTQVYSDAMNSSSGITSSAQSMLKEFQSQIDGMNRSEAMSFIKQKLAEKGAYDRVMAQNAYNNEMAELNNIQELTNQIDSTTDMKQIADLQARIQTAQGAIQGEQTKLQLMAMLQTSQDKILQEQKQYAQKRFVLGADGEDLSMPNVTE
ncbi:type IV secretion system protein [Salmonella enterica subsp. enterica serovar Montevideo]|nr:type IV secretion system protein [Salmonella enterica]EDO3942453.1 type IV secretion system protein [Salmonella enterica subsp. enterica serovar Montevideo]